MTNCEMLKDELRHKKITAEHAAITLKISKPTFFRKLNDPEKCFTTSEASLLAKLLNLDKDTAMRIFFGE